MSKENLFEDITLEEAKSALQEVSEHMDEVINERRRKLNRFDLDVTKDPQWNLADDALEIIHSSRASSGKAKDEGWATAMQEVSRRCCPTLEEAAKNAAERTAVLARETAMSMEEAASVVTWRSYHANNLRQLASEIEDGSVILKDIEFHNCLTGDKTVAIDYFRPSETLENKCDLHLTGVLTGSSIEKNPINIHIHGDVYNLDDFKNKVEEALREHVRQVNKAIERSFRRRR